MAIDASSAQQIAETRASRQFFVIVALILAAYATTGILFGLSGVGVTAVVMAGLMLLTCLVLTRG